MPSSVLYIKIPKQQKKNEIRKNVKQMVDVEQKQKSFKSFIFKLKVK